MFADIFKLINQQGPNAWFDTATQLALNIARGSDGDPNPLPTERQRLEELAPLVGRHVDALWGVPSEPVITAVNRSELTAAALAQWRSLTAGHTITYIASSECIVCPTPGRWKVVERDGALVSAEPLGGQDPATASLVPTVTQMLLAAVAAKGNATASVSAAQVFVTFDADPQISGDEGDITAENIELT